MGNNAIMRQSLNIPRNSLNSCVGVRDSGSFTITPSPRTTTSGGSTSQLVAREVSMMIMKATYTPLDTPGESL